MGALRLGLFANAPQIFEAYHFVGDTLDLDTLVWWIHNKAGLELSQFPKNFCHVLEIARLLGAKAEQQQLDIDFISLAMAKAKNGTEVTFYVGNHDISLMESIGRTCHGIHILEEGWCRDADGRRILISHGHIPDPAGLGRSKEGNFCLGYEDYKYALGDAVRRTLMNGAMRWDQYMEKLPVFENHEYCISNGIIGIGNICTPFENDGLAKWHPMRLGSVIPEYREAVIAYAKSKGAEGAICGHIHKRDIHYTKDGFVYANCGNGITTAHKSGLYLSPDNPIQNAPFNNTLHIQRDIQKAIQENREGAVDFLQHQWEKALEYLHAFHHSKNPCNAPYAPSLQIA